MTAILYIATAVLFSALPVLSQTGLGLEKYVPAPPYQDMIALPGTDFVGFGWDIRFIDPDQALRVPLMDWSYEQQKTYRYPLYKQRWYKVPDQIFVRTVGSVDASNYVFTSTDDYRKKLAFNLGFAFEQDSTAPVPPNTPAADTNQAQGQLDSTKNSGTGNSGTPAASDAALKGQLQQAQPPGNTASDAGFNKANSDGLLPAQYAGTASSAMSIGASLQVIDNLAQNNSQYIVDSDQYFILFQVLLSQVTYRAALARDMTSLQAKKYVDNKADFKAMFEKYGTHIVVNSMVGGAISFRSIMNTYTEVKTLNVSLSLNLTLASDSKTTNTSKNVTENLITNSPNCTGVEKGYSFNTYTQLCELPITATCWAPTNQFGPTGENFNYPSFNLSDPEAGLPWTRGPNTSPVKTTTAYKPPGYTPGIIASFHKPSTFEIFSVNKMYDALRVDSTQKEFSAVGVGITRYTNTITRPRLITFKNYIVGDYQGNHTTSTNNIEFWAEGDNTTRSDDRLFFRFNTLGSMSANKSAFMHILQKGAQDPKRNIELKVQIPVNSVAEYRLEIDWDNQPIGKSRIWLKDDMRPKFQLVAENIPFFNDVPGIERVDIYSFDKGSISFFDDIDMCNANGGGTLQPLTRRQALDQTTKEAKTRVSGHLDMDLDQASSNFKIQATHSYRLMGGDSSIVDLLTRTATVESFQKWKESLPVNPVSIVWTLKELSTLFPDQEFDGVNIRKEVHNGVKDFLTIQEVGDILYNSNPDGHAFEGLGGNKVEPVIV